LGCSTELTLVLYSDNVRLTKSCVGYEAGLSRSPLGQNDCHLLVVIAGTGCVVAVAVRPAAARRGVGAAMSEAFTVCSVSTFLADTHTQTYNAIEYYDNDQSASQWRLFSVTVTRWCRSTQLLYIEPG